MPKNGHMESYLLNYFLSSGNSSQENLSSGCPTRSDTNWVVQPLKRARGLKLRFLEEEGLHDLCSENKGADQLHGYCAVTCVFRFCICKFQVFS